MPAPHAFTYGSLMWADIMGRVCGQAFANEAASLADHRRQPVQGQDYRFRAEFAQRLLPGDWDANAFAREGRARFIARYAGFDALAPR